MLFLLLLAAIFIPSGICLAKAANSKWDSKWYNTEGLFGALTVIFGIFSIIMVLAIPINRSSVNHNIAKIHQLQKEISENREFFMHERAEVTRIQIIEWNNWIAEQKLDLTDPWFSAYTSEEVINLEPIK